MMPTPMPIIINPLGLDADGVGVVVHEKLCEPTGQQTLAYRQLTEAEVAWQQDAETVQTFLAADHSGDPTAEALAAFMRL